MRLLAGTRPDRPLTLPEHLALHGALPRTGRGLVDEAMLARMARANCLIVVDEDVTEVAAGGLVTVMPLLLGG